MRPRTQPFLWKGALFAWEWKIMGISKAKTSEKKNEQNIGQRMKQKIGQKQIEHKSRTKKFAQKIERDSRTKNHSKRSNKTSDNKFGQKIRRQTQPKIGHINSDEIVGQNSWKQNRTIHRTKYRAKKSNKKSDKESDKIVGQRNRIRHLTNSDKK